MSQLSAAEDQSHTSGFLLYIELTSNARDTALSHSSVPSWQNSKLNLTRVSSYAIRLHLVMRQCRSSLHCEPETKQRSFSAGTSYRQGRRLVFKVSDGVTFSVMDLSLRQRRIKQSRSEDECRGPQAFLFCWYMMCVERFFIITRRSN